MGLSDIEKEEIFRRVHNMDDEEMQIALMAVPAEHMWNELHRRYCSYANSIQGIKDLVRL